MGLFKKRVDPEEVTGLRAEIAAMAARLEAADAEQRRLAERSDPDEVTRLRAEIATMSARLEESDAEQRRLAERGDPEEVARLRSLIAAMSARVEQSDAEKNRLAERIEGITTRLEAPIEPPPIDAPTPATTADLDEVRDRLDQLHQRLDAVDQRITAISTELANQINEISGDLERLVGDEPPTEQVLDELRDAQTRLASEQARYQIAFRQDLADLVDRLRRS